MSLSSSLAQSLVSGNATFSVSGTYYLCFNVVYVNACSTYEQLINDLFELL